MRPLTKDGDVRASRECRNRARNLQEQRHGATATGNPHTVLSILPTLYQRWGCCISALPRFVRYRVLILQRRNREVSHHCLRGGDQVRKFL